MHLELVGLFEALELAPVYLQVILIGMLESVKLRVGVNVV